MDLQTLIQIPPRHVYKQGGRTRIWAVQHQGRTWVVKLAAPCSLGHRLKQAIGAHPLQREVRLNVRLQRRDVPVVPLEAFGRVRLADGRRALVAVYPWGGVSLNHWLDKGEEGPEISRPHLARRVGELAATLVHAGFVLRDFKPSNLMISPDGSVRLIDVGGVRRFWRNQRIWRMLKGFERYAARMSISRAERLRALKVLLDRCPWLGNLHQALAHLKGSARG